MFIGTWVWTYKRKGIQSMAREWGFFRDLRQVIYSGWVENTPRFLNLQLSPSNYIFISLSRFIFFRFSLHIFILFLFLLLLASSFPSLLSVSHSCMIFRAGQPTGIWKRGYLFSRFIPYVNAVPRPLPGAKLIHNYNPAAVIIVHFDTYCLRIHSFIYS